MLIKKKLKEICRKTNSYDEIKKRLQESYEQITDQPEEKGYDEKYDICDIIKSDIKTVFKKRLNKEDVIIFELIEYKNSPKGYVLVLNRFDNEKQTEFIMYI